MLSNILFADTQSTIPQAVEVQSSSPSPSPTLPPVSSLIDTGSQLIIFYRVFLLLLAVLVVVGIWSKKFELVLIFAGFLALILILVTLFI
jgi:hypothetical protein